MNVDMAMSVLDFAVERHKVWERRQAGDTGPWSDDPILQTRKFTNVYRFLDHGSQFLIKELLYGPDREELSAMDVLARCYLYRMTNRPAVWEYTLNILGRYPMAHDLDEGLISLWCDWRDLGNQVFSGAYVIMPRPGVHGVDKTRAVIELAAALFHPELSTNITWDFMQADSMADRFKVLRSQPAVGDFIAMQTLTDFGYSLHGGLIDQDENDFVMPGPGCRNGAKEVFPDKKAEYAVQWLQETLHALPDCPEVEGRKPSLIDCQNVWCEASKLFRYMRKPVSPKPYRATHPGPQPEPFLPPHWSSITV